MTSIDKNDVIMSDPVGEAMKQLWMDWQLFAEGESAPEGAGEGQDSTPPDAGEDFEALIRGRCKEEFDARVKKDLAKDIETALKSPGHAIAVAPLRTLLAQGGVLDQLRAKGYEVKTPGDED